MAKIINWIKTHPKTAALAVFGVGAVIVLGNRNSGGEATDAGNGTLGYGGVDGATTIQLAAVQAQADAAKNQAAAAVAVNETQAAAAIAINQQNTQAAIKINETNTNASVAVQTQEKVGINGIIHTTPVAQIEKAGRALGYKGAFGDGGLNRYVLEYFGGNKDKACAWVSGNGQPCYF